MRAAVLRWKVVFFRDQRLDHAGHVAFARLFGEPVVLPRRGKASPAGFPEIETTADRLELGGRFGMEHEEWLRRRRHTLLRGWHCDHGARVDPPAATILRAETVPPYGGDTTWANLAAAYAGLSAPLRAFVDTLRAEHRLGVGYQPRPGDDAYLRHLLDHQTATVHPLVRVHPETGERVLFVNGYYVEQITGLSRPESAAVLELLVEQATRRVHRPLPLGARQRRLLGQPRHHPPRSRRPRPPRPPPDHAPGDAHRRGTGRPCSRAGERDRAARQPRDGRAGPAQTGAGVPHAPGPGSATA
ncbi:hypothetical protein SVIOM342S_02782 [Streptomyces violaceorubidus]